MSLDQDTKRLIRKLAKIRSVEIPKASSSALNKATRSKIKSRIVKAVSYETKVKQKLIRKKIFITKSTPKTQLSKLVMYETDVPLISLLTESNIQKRLQPAKRKKRPLIRWKGEVFDGAFVVRPKKSGKSNEPHVFERTSKIRSTWPGDKRHKYKLASVRVRIKDEIERVTPMVVKRVMRREYPKLYKADLKYRLDKYAIPR